METADVTRQKIDRGTNPKAEPDYRDHYFPKTEQLGENEMRVTALGTGMPNARPAQASASWLIELGRAGQRPRSGPKSCSLAVEE